LPWLRGAERRDGGRQRKSADRAGDPRSSESRSGPEAARTKTCVDEGG
jgi:hypothetical protein